MYIQAKSLYCVLLSLSAIEINSLELSCSFCFSLKTHRIPFFMNVNKRQVLTQCQLYCYLVIGSLAILIAIGHDVYLHFSSSIISWKSGPFTMYYPRQEEDGLWLQCIHQAMDRWPVTAVNSFSASRCMLFWTPNCGMFLSGIMCAVAVFGVYAF